MNADEKRRLEQTESLYQMFEDVSPSNMVTVYRDERNFDEDAYPRYWHSIYSVFVSKDKVREITKQYDWDVPYERTGMPCTGIMYEKGKETPFYSRYGVGEGFEPLIICRNFGGLRGEYNEISEEFRLFHNLYHSKKSPNEGIDEYIKIEADGTESIVAVAKPGEIKIRLKEIRQYLAVKEMYLSVQFHYTEYSNYKLEDLGLEETVKDKKEKTKCWVLRFGLCGFSLMGDESFSDLRGKYLIAPFRKEDSNVFGYATDSKKYEDFIVGEDENGKPIYRTCSPRRKDRGEYLQPVCFKRELLDAYYSQSDKYKISRRYLLCGCLWSIDIQTHNDDVVYAYIGDIGEKLPHSEQLRWKGYNVIPKGYGESMYPHQLDFSFREKYKNFNERCRKTLGWDLYLPLNDDQYRLDSIKILCKNQGDFDALVQNLAIILVEKFNIKELAKKAKVKFDKRSSRTDRLNQVMPYFEIDDYEIHTTFLGELYNIRSKSTALLKGDDYREYYLKLCGENCSPSDMHKEILKRAIEWLYFLDIVLDTPRK